MLLSFCTAQVASSILSGMSPINDPSLFPDTMAYTASALSFLLEDLGKTVVS